MKKRLIVLLFACLGCFDLPNIDDGLKLKVSVDLDSHCACDVAKSGE